jgi:SOS response regulatory protein OraA/RecX
VKRRLIAYLARRGFRGSLAVDAIDAARQAARDFLSG